MAYIGQQFGLGRPESFVFTASGGETSVSTADDGRSIVYTPGTVTVFLNGVRLVEGTDYAATSGSGVSGLSALVSGDVLVVVVLASQSVADTVSAASGGEFLGDVTVPELTATTGVFSGDVTLTNGLLKTTNLPAWRVQSDNISSGTGTVLETTDLDQTNVVDLTNNRVVINTDGVYLITVTASFFSTGPDYRGINCQVLKNGALIGADANITSITHITSATYMSATFTFVDRLNVNDILTLQTTSATGIYSLYFSGVYLS